MGKLLIIFAMSVLALGFVASELSSSAPYPGLSAFQSFINRRQQRGLMNSDTSKLKECRIEDFLDFIFCEHSLGQTYDEFIGTTLKQVNHDLAATAYQFSVDVTLSDYYERDDILDFLYTISEKLQSLSHNLLLPYDSTQDLVAQVQRQTPALLEGTGYTSTGYYAQPSVYKRHAKQGRKQAGRN